ncbi:hypothetical protein KC332_g11086 [Hortaea werneckii]|nr:hypothetical protein KC348_g11361 [Hortaea werneckii]KAI6929476.1 hypothetical protein KC341_g10825 [Hortaea werneckii]KAI7014188.1 hypothetical protein KC366_g15880 [Hortaea werneckii]KAI7066218.1 hypothetical protein KC327_g11088 [Hortaea werneckii]KAI7253946.1 hypothetical protein KC335_g14761 [Hortaea werneckii]
MWTLECASDLFGGKRRWLRPGSVHLLGRTSGKPQNGERIAFIEDRSVSRKHLVIHVGNVDPADSGRIHKKTEIRLEDSSKTGTQIDDDRISKSSKTLDESRSQYILKLGNYEHLFKLRWEPVVITFTSVGKKAGLDQQKEKLEGTDVKLLTEYITNETTHSVNKKRNQPQVLQALVQGRWVVSYDWVDALAERTKRNGDDANGEPLNAPLEDDFDGNWPRENDYPVPVSQEPRPRPADYLKPRPERMEVFQDYIFVFLSASQYESLMPVITSGGGKALLWEVQIGASKVEDVVDYVRQVAGGKNADRNFRLSQHEGRGGVVLVRINERDENWHHWTAPFMQELEQTLDQRAILQGELLDPILTLDTSELRRQLPESQDEDGVSGNAQPSTSKGRGSVQEDHSQPDSMQQGSSAQQDPPSTQPQAEEQQADVQPEPEAPSATATRRRNRRPLGQSRFKAFDDFEMSQFAQAASRSPEPVDVNMGELSQAPNMQSMDVDQHSQTSHAEKSQPGARKRPAPIQEESEPEEDVYADMFPGQAALKRRKTEAARIGESSTFSKATLEAEKEFNEKKAKAKKKRDEKPIDVQAELKARREHEEELRRKDEESLREMMEGVDIAALQNLAKIEEFELPDRQRPRPARGTASDAQDLANDRWDPAWNGRKNFKKFRPQGHRRNTAPRLQRVIVALEEAPKDGHDAGLMDFWPVSSNKASKSKSKSQQSQSQSLRPGRRSQTTVNDDDDDDDDEETGDAARFRRRIQRSYEEDAQQGVNDDDMDLLDVGGYSRNSRADAMTNVSSTMSQTLGTESQRRAAGKRPAVAQGGGPAKKSKQTSLAPSSRSIPVNVDDDDDEDDGLKFRRRRR